jgi:hypothetical protein
MTRQDRISSAKGSGWVKQYGGKNIIKSYANWFAVDLLCAVIELRMLGMNITPEREAQIKASIEARAAENRRRKSTAAEAELEGLYSESDDTFAYIADYTPSGAPYGVTWEEVGEEPPWLDDEHEVDEEDTGGPPHTTSPPHLDIRQFPPPTREGSAAEVPLSPSTTHLQS